MQVQGLTVPQARRTQEARSAPSGQRVTAAAVARIVELGLAGATLAAIGDRAGDSRGRVTHRFGSQGSVHRQPSPTARCAASRELGAGLMGWGITHVAAAAGMEVILRDATQQRAGEGKRHSERLLHMDVGAQAKFASNTSPSPMTVLADAWPFPKRFVGSHLFSLVERMPWIEIVCSPKTGYEALAMAFDYAAPPRKTPIRVDNSLGSSRIRAFGQ
ncbi:3-hydroxyacyl-CoA dehydrogenase NAD-binding domain-containing protein [Sinimarinibacterium thermocellulolyticum]|uniref:3-hydroxyacyl-CoA dehydrogenase NAD-binding domain-containing protein n=1 Tax=Sinimarinibacterium thermocellulolyticum TaxID=3170016 RepID=A0ABV2AE02_9GAMM